MVVVTSVTEVISSVLPKVGLLKKDDGTRDLVLSMPGPTSYIEVSEPLDLGTFTGWKTLQKAAPSIQKAFLKLAKEYVRQAEEKK